MWELTGVWEAWVGAVWDTGEDDVCAEKVELVQEYACEEQEVSRGEVHEQGLEQAATATQREYLRGLDHLQSLRGSFGKILGFPRFAPGTRN